VRRRATRKNKKERRNGSKEHERTKSSIDGGEMATEIEIATEKGISVAGEWMMTRAAMIRAVTGRNFYILWPFFKKFILNSIQSRIVLEYFVRINID